MISYQEDANMLLTVSFEVSATNQWMGKVKDGENVLETTYQACAFIGNYQLGHSDCNKTFKSEKTAIEDVKKQIRLNYRPGSKSRD